jgi:hypothetical protein
MCFSNMANAFIVSFCTKRAPLTAKKKLDTLNSNQWQYGKVKIRSHAAVPLIQYPGSVSCPGARILMQKSLCENQSSSHSLCSLIKNWGALFFWRVTSTWVEKGEGEGWLKGSFHKRMYWLYLRSPASNQGQPIACSSERRKTKRGCPTTDQICLKYSSLN